jgi:hypothetical protein
MPLSPPVGEGVVQEERSKCMFSTACVSHALFQKSMMPSLLIMMGNGKMDAALSPKWIEQLDMMREKALPMIAVSPNPHPSVLLDTEKRPDGRDLIRSLRSAGTDLVSLVVWGALIASDLSVTDTFLLVNVIKPLECRIILRFHLLRHHSTLARIEHLHQLTICTTPPQECVRLALDVPDLGEQLAQVQVYQDALLQKREE